jgi:hypothetical protein
MRSRPPRASKALSGTYAGRPVEVYLPNGATLYVRFVPSNGWRVCDTIGWMVDPESDI